MEQTYRVQLSNGTFIDVVSYSSEEAAQMVVLTVEVLTEPTLENLHAKCD